MQAQVKNFLEDLEKQIPDLLQENEEMAAILVANLFVDHGIPPNLVLRALMQAGLASDAKQLAAFRNKREEFLTVLKSL
jgi:hypothetical protein